MGENPALPVAAVPRRCPRAPVQVGMAAFPGPAAGPSHCSAGAGLGTGRIGSTCTKEDSDWLQVFSKAADFNSIFCCLGQKSSPCSSWGSHPAGVAPRQLGLCFLSLCSSHLTFSCYLPSV